MQNTLKLSILLAVALPFYGQTLDKYGGATSLPCPTGPKPLFYTEKINNRWWFCTPAGNAFWMHSVWNVQPTSPSDRAGQKFGGALGTTESRTAVVARRLPKWNFNAFDAYATRRASPTANTHLQLAQGYALPVIIGEGLRPSFYGLANTNNLISQPLKCFDTSLYWSTASAARTNAWRLQDIFDSNYRAYLLAMLNRTTASNGGDDNAYNHVFTSTPEKRSYVLGYSVDDTDWVSGFGAGPNFPTFDNGNPILARRHPNIAVMALYAPPTQGVTTRSPATGSGKVFADPRTATVSCLGAEEAGAKGLAGYS